MKYKTSLEYLYSEICIYCKCMCSKQYDLLGYDTV